MCVFVFDFHTLGGRASIELVGAKGQRTVIDLYGVLIGSAPMLPIRVGVIIMGIRRSAV